VRDHELRLERERREIEERKLREEISMAEQDRVK
jgi:hypothetical protein